MQKIILNAGRMVTGNRKHVPFGTETAVVILGREEKKGCLKKGNKKPASKSKAVDPTKSGSMRTLCRRMLFHHQHLCIFPSSYGTFIYLHALDGERAAFAAEATRNLNEA